MLDRAVWFWTVVLACRLMSSQPEKGALPESSQTEPVDDRFVLYDLRVEVVATDRPMVCGHRAGDFFEVSGEELSLPPNQSFSIYALAALLPLLPAKQRATAKTDWMSTDHDIACPDPHCGALFRITRTGRREFRHSEVTAVELQPSRSDQIVDD